MYDHYFSNFGRAPVSDDICKDVKVQPKGILGFGEQDFLKVFTIQMHRKANLTLP